MSSFQSVGPFGSMLLALCWSLYTKLIHQWASLSPKPIMLGLYWGYIRGYIGVVLGLY